jgi:two-component system, NtrC family, response regulator HydG
MREKILIVEDQFIEANNLQEMLETAGYRVTGIARSVPKAQELIAHNKPDLVLLDIFLKGPLTGIDLAKQLREQNIPFVYLSANSDKNTLDAAKATHPSGFLVKPFREKDVLVMLEIARYAYEHRPQSTTQKSYLKAADIPLDDIIGNSNGLQEVLRYVKIAAPVDTSVLLLGESGTGKERIAESIHEHSSRADKPLVKVNCAALPPALVESVLFGHEKGAFTGAVEKRIGKFEMAQGGTIFLDEIGEMPLDIQTKFLRALQEREIERVGNNQSIKIDVRIIAATNRNLEKEVAEGNFRMDLYFRLNVFPIHIPPLRERKDDITILADHFINLYSKRYNKSVTKLADHLVRELSAYHWPGNIRELEHLIERSVLLSEGTTITVLPDFRIHNAIAKTEASGTAAIKTMEEMERDHILQVLEKCNGKVFGKGGAAELLGMNVSTLNSRIKKLGIEKEAKFSKGDS